MRFPGEFQEEVSAGTSRPRVPASGSAGGIEGQGEESVPISAVSPPSLLDRLPPCLPAGACPCPQPWGCCFHAAAPLRSVARDSFTPHLIYVPGFAPLSGAPSLCRDSLCHPPWLSWAEPASGQPGTQLGPEQTGRCPGPGSQVVSPGDAREPRLPTASTEVAAMTRRISEQSESSGIGHHHPICKVGKRSWRVSSGPRDPSGAPSPPAADTCPVSSREGGTAGEWPVRCEPPQNPTGWTLCPGSDLGLG